MPYAPAVNDQGAEFLFRGISQAGNGLARGFEQMMAMKQKRAEEEKFTQGMVKALAPKFADFGYESKEEMLNDSSENVLGRVKGQMLNSAMAEREQAMNLRTLQQQGLLRQQKQDNEISQFAGDFATGDPQAMGEFVNQTLYRPMGSGVPEATPEMLQLLNRGANPSPDARMIYAMGRHPEVAASPQFDNFMAGLQQFFPTGGSGGPSLVFEEDPVSGNRFARAGKQVLPSGMNPAKEKKKEAVDTSAPPPSHEIPGLPGAVAVWTGTKWEVKTPRQTNGDAPAGLIDGIVRQLTDAKALGARKVKIGTDGAVNVDPMFGGEPIDAVIQRLSASNAPAPASKPSDDRVVVVNPDGKKFSLPKSQLEDAKKQGYKLVQ